MGPVCADSVTVSVGSVCAEASFGSVTAFMGPVCCLCHCICGSASVTVGPVYTETFFEVEVNNAACKVDV